MPKTVEEAQIEAAKVATILNFVNILLSSKDRQKLATEGIEIWSRLTGTKTHIRIIIEETPIKPIDPEFVIQNEEPQLNGPIFHTPKSTNEINREKLTKL